MALTDIKVKTAKPKDKPYKLADGGGMYLLINTNGSKYWRMKYRFAGKEKRHCCKVSDEAAFCLIQRPYISKTLLTRRISPRGSP